jgi:hypothetical protein
MRVGIDFGEFCAEQKNLSRIIDPQQKDDQPAGSSKAGSNCTAPDVPANELLSDAEEHGGNDCADHHVAPFKCAVRQDLIDGGEQEGYERYRNDDVQSRQDNFSEWKNGVEIVTERRQASASSRYRCCGKTRSSVSS